VLQFECRAEKFSPAFDGDKEDIILLPMSHDLEDNNHFHFYNSFSRLMSPGASGDLFARADFPRMLHTSDKGGQSLLLSLSPGATAGVPIGNAV
jgi:hypothetical protein